MDTEEEKQEQEAQELFWSKHRYELLAPLVVIFVIYFPVKSRSLLAYGILEQRYAFSVSYSGYGA